MLICYKGYLKNGKRVLALQKLRFVAFSGSLLYSKYRCLISR
ncbi:hypothetical protein EIKCOROL_02617 [Eikenella corrodens ATCC 23834]|uniref:Uncharacterized protein n=1 Tax=Eikenella corrodens ATCC 23834 TaxID=546274 RepID=C0DZ01_EIKCO|nr:hypothetical protein EIKCOROL_02617 [Eikenella corrodens ATCC 23834]